MNFIVCNWKIGIKSVKMRLCNAVKLRNKNWMHKYVEKEAAEVAMVPQGTVWC